MRVKAVRAFRSSLLFTSRQAVSYMISGDTLRRQEVTDQLVPGVPEPVTIRVGCDATM